MWPYSVSTSAPRRMRSPYFVLEVAVVGARIELAVLGQDETIERPPARFRERI